MKVLVACEESQEVCKAFRELGHEAYSCDILPCSGGHPEWHIQDDVLNHLDKGWDLMIAHPPCTYLSYAGTRSWNKEGRVWKRLEALNFFAKLWTAAIPLICIENPRGCASPTIAKYSQMIQPYFFGDEESKTTWLWIKGLPELKPTKIVKPKVHGISPKGKKIYFEEAQNKNRAFIRSKTFPGIAKAMAEQWGNAEKINSQEIYVEGKPMIPPTQKTSGNVNSVTPDNNSPQEELENGKFESRRSSNPFEPQTGRQCGLARNQKSKVVPKIKNKYGRNTEAKSNGLKQKEDTRTISVETNSSKTADTLRGLDSEICEDCDYTKSQHTNEFPLSCLDYKKKEEKKEYPNIKRFKEMQRERKEMFNSIGLSDEEKKE